MPKLVWLLISTLVAVVLAAVPTPAGLTPPAQRALAITLLAAMLWTTEALPLPATGLACVALMAVTGVSPSLSDALHGYSQPVPYFLYGVLVLGVAAARSGLAERVARWFLSLAKGRPALLYWQLVWSFVPLCFILSSATSRTGLQVPIYHEALLLLKAGPGSRLGKAVMQALAQLNRVASNALLTGGIAPVMAAALLGGIGWTEWFVLMSVPVLGILVLGAIAVYLMYQPFEAAPQVETLVPDRPATGASGSRWAELRVCAILAGVSALWLTDSWHHLDPALPALFGAILTVTPRVGVLSWAEVERGVGVSMFFTLAASISLAHGVVATGASAWLGGLLMVLLRPFAGNPMLLVVLLLLACLVARVVLTSVTAYLTVLIPVVMALAQSVGLNPLACGLLVAFVGDAVLYYPAQSSSSLLPFQYDYLSAGDVLRFGLVMTLLALVVGLFVALPYWAWLGQPLAYAR